LVERGKGCNWVLVNRHVLTRQITVGIGNEVRDSNINLGNMVSLQFRVPAPRLGLVSVGVMHLG
jgi:hypothetical protein